MSTQDATIRLGCQTFTWEMSGAGSTPPEQLVEAIADAGYAGIEITDNMIGRFADDPMGFAALLRAQGLSLVAYTISPPSGFTRRAARDDDLRRVGEALRWLRAFPGACLTLGSATATGAGSVDEMFDIAAEIYDAAGKLARAAGVQAGIHASSHEGTILRTAADYRRILALTDPALVGWVPDTGHMIRGGHDMIGMLEAHAARINYIHLKDIDAAGEWAMLGDGITDTRTILDFMRRALPEPRWLVLEEESHFAAAQPAAAVAANHKLLAGLL